MRNPLQHLRGYESIVINNLSHSEIVYGDGGYLTLARMLRLSLELMWVASIRITAGCIAGTPLTKLRRIYLA